MIFVHEYWKYDVLQTKMNRFNRFLNNRNEDLNSCLHIKSPKSTKLSMTSSKGYIICNLKAYSSL